MAAHKMEIKLEWENSVHFTMKAKMDGGDEVSLIKVQEDACIKCVWRHVADFCITYITTKLHEIGNEMVLP